MNRTVCPSMWVWLCERRLPSATDFLPFPGIGTGGLCSATKTSELLEFWRHQFGCGIQRNAHDPAQTKSLKHK